MIEGPPKRDSWKRTFGRQYLLLLFMHVCVLRSFADGVEPIALPHKMVTS